MLCDECKEKPATVHLTQVYNGQINESHLCEDCAAQKSGLIFGPSHKFSIPNILGGMFGAIYNVQDVSESSTKCSNCGMSYQDIKRVGKLGCSECYKVYEPELESSLRSIHGNSKHLGKIPVRGGEKVLVKRQIEELKNQIQEAVREEKYEQAAQIRDRVIEMEKKLS